MADSADKPALNDEIEITPAMLAAGLEALSHWDDSDENNISAAYVAMERVRRGL